MVEGGATVIRSFFDHLTPNSETRLVDSVIVTVAPIMVGDDGVGYGSNVRSSAVSDSRAVMLFSLKCSRYTH